MKLSRQRLTPNMGQTVSLYRTDYESMLPKRWLRTAPIDILIKLQLKKQLNQICKVYASRGILAQQQHRQYVKMVDVFVVTMMMTYQDETILQSLQPLQLFSTRTKYLIIPVNTQNANGSHWLLGCFINGGFGGQKKKSHLLMFDSGGSSMVLGQLLKHKLQNLHQILIKQELEIELSRPQNIPEQTNSYDCGIFTIGFAQYILKQIVNELQEKNQDIKCDRLKGEYRYLLGNSALSRQRYRRLLQEKLLEC